MSNLRVVNTAVSPLETPPEGLQRDYIGTAERRHDQGFYPQYQAHHPHREWDLSPPSSAASLSTTTDPIHALPYNFPPPPVSVGSMSGRPSSSPTPGMFDAQQRSLTHIQPETQEHATNLTDDDFDLDSFNLKPPPAPPPFAQNGLETLMDRLHSTDHLDIILSDSNLFSPFFRFIETYRPAHLESIKQYSQARKALAALDFANALASRIPSSSSSHAPYTAATLDPRFEAKVQRMVGEVVEDALPAYVTYRLVRLATDSLVKEITGTSSPVMRTLIPDLATVYCISDPSLPDNPIVYASEEFHSTTLYTPAQCLNRNCRFLQGPHTSQSSIRRLVAALTAGQEICETILNYRRDGSPFVNLLMIAPLYDNKGAVRYFLGCQIDVSGLIEEGKGVESLNVLLRRDRDRDLLRRADAKDPALALSDLASRLSPEETASLLHHHHTPPPRPATSGNGLSSLSSHSSARLSFIPHRARLILHDDKSDPSLYPHSSLGTSGRLPGVYQNYLLVRPFPSLRITFLSPSLRIPGLLQSAFLDRIAGPESIREGLRDAFERGIGVTAKVLWNSASSTSESRLGSTEGSRDGSQRHSNASSSAAEQHAPRNPKSRWIHCTPLMGSDGRVGVWMVVMVEDESVSGALKRSIPSAVPAVGAATPAAAVGQQQGMVDSGIAGLGQREYAAGTDVRDMAVPGAGSRTSEGSQMYAEYLRGVTAAQGGSGVEEMQRPGTSASVRERREVDEVFRGF